MLLLSSKLTSSILGITTNNMVEIDISLKPTTNKFGNTRKNPKLKLSR